MAATFGCGDPEARDGSDGASAPGEVATTYPPCEESNCCGDGCDPGMICRGWCVAECEIRGCPDGQRCGFDGCIVDPVPEVPACDEALVVDVDLPAAALVERPAAPSKIASFQADGDARADQIVWIGSDLRHFFRVTAEGELQDHVEETLPGIFGPPVGLADLGDRFAVLWADGALEFAAPDGSGTLESVAIAASGRELVVRRDREGAGDLVVLAGDASPPSHLLTLDLDSLAVRQSEPTYLDVGALATFDLEYDGQPELLLPHTSRVDLLDRDLVDLETFETGVIPIPGLGTLAAVGGASLFLVVGTADGDSIATTPAPVWRSVHVVERRLGGTWTIGRTPNWSLAGDLDGDGTMEVVGGAAGTSPEDLEELFVVRLDPEGTPVCVVTTAVSPIETATWMGTSAGAPLAVVSTDRLEIWRIALVPAGGGSGSGTDATTTGTLTGDSE